MSDERQIQSGFDPEVEVPTDWSPSLVEDGLAPPTAEEAELLRDLDNLVHNSPGLGSAEMPALSLPASESKLFEDAAEAEAAAAEEGSAKVTRGEARIPSGVNPRVEGSPEEWSALAAIGALDGEAVAEMEIWLKTAKTEEIEIFSRRMRIGHALVYSLNQEPPPASLRDSLAQSLGEQSKDGRHLYPRRSLPLTQRLAEAMGWKQTRLLKLFSLFLLLLAMGGWGIAWRGHQKILRLTAMSIQSEKARQEAEGAHKAATNRLDFLATVDLVITVLQGKEESREKSAHLLWSPFGRKALLWVGGLPKAPEGKEYALWVALGTRTYSALRFTESSTGEGGLFLDIPLLQEGRPRPIQAFYLTLQPQGALEAEDGERLFSGSAYR